MDSTNPDSSESPRRQRAGGDRLRRSAILAAAALGAAGASLGVAAIASAGSGATKTTKTAKSAVAHRHGWFAGARSGVFGTVASIGTGSFTLTTQDGTTVTVDVTGATTYKDPGTSSASLADVTVGQHVAVTGTDTSNTVAATGVFIGGSRGGSGFRGRGAWGGGARSGVFGTVASVGTGSFTLTTQDGTTVTVDVTGATTYKDPGTSSASLADVTVGQHVAVTGTDTSNTVAATGVFIGGSRGGSGFRGRGAWGGGARSGVFGTVASVGTGSFTLTTQDGTTVTVDVTGATTYKDPGTSSASLADVTVGQHVAVTGTDTSNTVAATGVFIGGSRGGSGFRGHGAWGG